MPHIFIQPRPNVHVWGLEISILRNSHFHVFEQLIDEPELECAQRMQRPLERRTYVAAHGLKRLQLSFVTGLDPHAIVFKRSAAGKPFVQPAIKGLQFSLSHTRGFVCVASAFGYDIGIDVEDRNNRVDMHRIALRHFGPDEYSEFSALTADSARDRFFASWTIKEAVLKAVGAGLRIPLSALEAHTSPPRVVSRHAAVGAGTQWRVMSFRPTPAHMLALALRPTSTQAA